MKLKKHSLIDFRNIFDLDNSKSTFIPILIYIILFLTIKYIVMAVATFLQVSRNDDLEEIGSAVMNFHIPTAAIASIVMATSMKFLYPIVIFRYRDLFDNTNIKEVCICFSKGLLTSTIILISLLIGLSFASVTQFLGSFIQIDEAVGTFALSLGLIFFIFSMIVFEEFIIRDKLIKFCKSKNVYINILMIAFAFTFFKVFQFSLKGPEIAGVLILNLYITSRLFSGENKMYTSGFYFGILFISHVMFSIPIFREDYNGFLLFKHDDLDMFSKIIFGGNQGVLAGFALQIILLIMTSINFLKIYNSNKLT